MCVYSLNYKYKKSYQQTFDYYIVNGWFILVLKIIEGYISVFFMNLIDFLKLVKRSKFEKFHFRVMFQEVKNNNFSHSDWSTMNIKRLWII